MTDVAPDLSGWVLQLERTVVRLADEVAALRALVDPDGIRAAEEMRWNPVTNGQLRDWRDIRSSPTGLAISPKKGRGDRRSHLGRLDGSDVFVSIAMSEIDSILLAAGWFDGRNVLTVFPFQANSLCFRQQRSCYPSLLDFISANAGQELIKPQVTSKSIRTSRRTLPPNSKCSRGHSIRGCILWARFIAGTGILSLMNSAESIC